MSGHGWVHPNKDGSVARCGGPGLCMECSLEADQKKLEDLGAFDPPTPERIENAKPAEEELNLYRAHLRLALHALTDGDEYTKDQAIRALLDAVGEDKA